MKIYLLLFALAVLLLPGCSKRNDDHSINARVVEYGSGKPIAGAGIVVHRYENKDASWNGSTIPYDSVVSDANGNFFIDGSEYRPTKLKIYTKDANYYDERVSSLGTVYIETSFIENPVIELYPFAWLQLEVDYNVFRGEFDYVRTSPVAGCGGGCLFIFYGDTLLPTIRVQGNRYNYLPMFGYKPNGEMVAFQNDSIYCKGFDTTYHEIRY